MRSRLGGEERIGGGGVGLVGLHAFAGKVAGFAGPGASAPLVDMRICYGCVLGARGGEVTEEAVVLLRRVVRSLRALREVRIDAQCR
eukprot:jgi/Ulvmu1/3572/UM168_0004.1